MLPSSRAQIRSPSSISVTADGVGFATYLQAHGFNVSPVPFYRAAARVALHAVLDKEPKLTIWGIGVGGPKRKANGQRENPREFQARFVAEREQLLTDFAIEPFLLSLALVAKIAHRTIGSGTGSYGLKHIAEKYKCTYPEGEQLGPQYVPNGVAIHCGCTTCRISD